VALAGGKHVIPRIRRIQVRNYKSLAQVDVTLERLTVLIGPNGSGKSNFIDALAFVQECLAESIELAFKNRGGIGAVRRRSGGHPTHVGVRLVIDLGQASAAEYAFEIAAKPRERFSVSRERCTVWPSPLMEQPEGHTFEICNGEFSTPIPGIRPKVSKDRLALFAASATEEFRPVYDFLTSMRFYSIAPPQLRELQEPDPGDFLKRDGSNAAAVLKRLQEEDSSENYQRLCRLLARVVAGVERAEYRAVGQKETLQFKQDIGLKHPWTFDALNMSDGTLRVLGLLLALYQPGRATMIAVEEPEATVHPAAAELLVEVFLDACKERQIVITTHSPDLLDSKNVQDSMIRAGMMQRGATLIAPVIESGRAAIRTQLYTPGELLRSGELEPDVAAAQEASSQLNLFGPPLTRPEAT
jgi:predicted ATPase